MKRHHVRLRPKARDRRRSVWLVYAAAAGIAAAAGFALRSRSWRDLDVRSALKLPLPEAAAVRSVSISGAPEPLASMMREAVGLKPGERWGLLRVRSVRAGLLAQFPCAGDIRARRSWSGQSVDFEVSLRRPLAKLRLGGKPAGFLAAAGIRFEAPEGLFASSGLPEVHYDGAAGADMGELSALLESVGPAQALPAGMRKMWFEPETDGWSAELANGVRLAWGPLSRTDEKLRRLREVLADATPRFGTSLTADLRHFEDGKIYVRPFGGH